MSILFYLPYITLESLIVSSNEIEIAFEYCPFSASASFAPDSQPDYKEACREVAYGVCKGAVGEQVYDNGCSISTSDLLGLQKMCEQQVDMMTGGGSSLYDDDDKWHGSGDDEFVGIIRTKLPTLSPSLVSFDSPKFCNQRNIGITGLTCQHSPSFVFTSDVGPSC
jgi:hypothetical protein